MREYGYLLKRNMLVFLRDYTAVFFSFLSMLIVLALMVFFLGSMNSDNLVYMLAQVGGERNTAQDRVNAEYLIQMWTLAGILVVNAVSVTLTVVGGMVEDEAKSKLASFYVSPVKRIKIALGYIGSAWTVGVMMCVLSLVLGELYMVLKGHPLLAPTDFAKLFGMIALNVFVYAAIGYLLALCVHSTSGWSGLLTVVGTLVGFLGGVYLPMSMLPEGVADVLKCLPVLHGAAMMREVCTKDAIAETFAGLPDVATGQFREQMGISIFRNGGQVTLQNQILFLLLCGIIAIVVAAVIGKRRRLRDR